MSERLALAQDGERGRRLVGQALRHREHPHPDVVSGGRLDLTAAGHTGGMGGTEDADE
jgi:hypothetical protein